MIRFLDKEVFAISYENYMNGFVTTYYEDRRKRRDIFCIYQENNYYGIATYFSVINRINGTGINTERVILDKKNITEMWNVLHQIIADKNLDYIPIFNENMQLMYFAYEGNSIMYRRYMESFYRELDEVEDIVFIEDIWPQIKKIRIHGYNEFADIFRRALIKRGKLRVSVDGPMWKFFYPEYEIDAEDMEMISESNIMDIYAEGTDSIRCECYDYQRPGYETLPDGDFIITCTQANEVRVQQRWRKYLNDRGVKFYWFTFPEVEDLIGTFTYEEEWRCRHGIEPENVKLNWNDKRVREQMKKVGGYNSRDDWEKVEEARSEQYVILGGHKVYYKKYGSGFRSIYLIGACIVRGYDVGENESLGAYLYEEVSKYSKDWSVVCISSSVKIYRNWKQLIESIMLMKNDIVIYISNTMREKARNLWNSAGEYIDLLKIYEKRKRDWFWDAPIHTNSVGNYEIAKFIANEYINKEIVQAKLIGYKMVQKRKIYLDDVWESELNAFLERTKEADATGNIGAVVMNCNPITYGHLQLIECALKQVDFLYIFIVEEDRSEYTFKDRMTMVKNATKQYKNVAVKPSGHFIISNQTLPIYFKKAQEQTTTIDAMEDLILFCDKIAPFLGIKIRFVGEEPFDKITKQYNESMKILFPFYKIELVELPRYKVNNEIVSASKVREYLKRGEKEKAKKLIPHVNWEIVEKCKRSK